MLREPSPSELAELEIAAAGVPRAVKAFDAYVDALYTLREEREDADPSDLRFLEAALGMARCELDIQLGPLARVLIKPADMPS